MQINKIHKASEIYAASSVKKVSAKDPQVSKKDKLSISDTAKYFQLAFKAAKNSPDIRIEKVEKIKEQIESGTYNVSAEEVAKKMLKSSFDQYR